MKQIVWSEQTLDDIMKETDYLLQEEGSIELVLDNDVYHEFVIEYVSIYDAYGIHTISNANTSLVPLANLYECFIFVIGYKQALTDSGGD